jgi:hypothetical protein
MDVVARFCNLADSDSIYSMAFNGGGFCVINRCPASTVDNSVWPHLLYSGRNS